MVTPTMPRPPRACSPVRAAASKHVLRSAGVFAAVLGLIAGGGPAAGAGSAAAGTAGATMRCVNPRPSALPRAVIRVDQAGYPTRAAKLAEIMTTANHSGGVRWLLIRHRDCTVAASGTAKTNLGSWSKRYPRVWLARFSQVKATGEYRIILAGDRAIASPWFRIARASRLYSRPLANALFFYAAERDGPSFIRSPLRTAPGHLNDAH